MVKRFLLFFCLIMSVKYTVAQQEVDFVPPIAGQLFLSGTFGELRSGHFHTGIDIKTAGVVGKEIFSIEDGYISRIFVSPSGYGKALYIRHKNGYTSVYAHLLSFEKTIAEYVRNYQFSKERFAVDIQVPEGVLPVSKGQLIALSGNSGSSGGPHLHFEIRETKSENPVNPTSFNFLEINDKTAPIISKVCVFPFDTSSFVNGENASLQREVVKNGSYVLAENNVIKIQGPTYFGVSTIDKMDGSNNKNGVYLVKCYFDSTLIYHFQVDKTSFSQGQCANGVIDYPEYAEKKIRFYKTYREPNNRSMMLRKVGNNGVVNLHDDKIHNVTFEVVDTHGNKSKVGFKVTRDDAVYQHATRKGQYRLKYDEDADLYFGDVLLNVEKNTLFDDVCIDFLVKKSDNQELMSPIYAVGDSTLVAFGKFQLSIKLPEEIPANLYKKLYLVSESNGKYSYVGGKLDDGWLTAQVRSFGNYAIKADTIPPSISSKYLLDNDVTDVSQRKRVRVTIEDAETGIASYYPTLNGKWILMDYDAKNAVLIYEFDEHLQKGLNELKIVVKDKVGNVSEYVRRIKY